MNKNIIKHEEKASYRLNKYISDSGFCSRREADRLIEDGKVKINGELAVLGTKVFSGDIVTVNNMKIEPKTEKVYIMLHKPTGITCTTDLKDPTNIVDYIKHKEKIFPIGRLDKDSSGLILLTNDGDIVNKILREEYGHEKEYVVTLNKEISEEFINKMQEGVIILNQVTGKHERTLPTKIVQTDRYTFKLILKQGLNRQIRRMADELGYQVKSLKRIRVMNLRLKDLEVGMWRYLTNEELLDIAAELDKHSY